MSWADLGDAAAELAVQISADGYRPDLILGIARGGLLVAGALSYALERQELVHDERRVLHRGRRAAARADDPAARARAGRPARLADADRRRCRGHRADARAGQGLLRGPGRRGPRRRPLREATLDRQLRVRLAANRPLDRLPLVDEPPVRRRQLDAARTAARISSGPAKRPTCCFEKTSCPSTRTSNWLFSPGCPRVEPAGLQLGHETRGPFVVAASDGAVVDRDRHAGDSSLSGPISATAGSPASAIVRSKSAIEVPDHVADALPRRRAPARRRTAARSGPRSPRARAP